MTLSASRVRSVLKPLLLGGSIYGAGGIIASQVFYCFPAALMILVAALSMGGAHVEELARLRHPRQPQHRLELEAADETIRTLKAKGYTIVLVEQNFRFAAPLADRFYVMEHGRIVKQFEQRELADNMAMLQEYLGV